MTEFNKMSIDELQAEMAKAEHSSGISPVEAILISKSLKFLSDEIAVFKEAICLESKALKESSNVISLKLVEIVQAVGSTSERLLKIEQAAGLTSERLLEIVRAVGSTSERLLGIVQVVGATSDNFKKASENAEKASRVQIRQTYAIIGLTAALFLATATMAWVGYKQMQEAQRLTKVSQEQIDLQLQPALMVKTDNSIGDRRELYLVNIGNGPAVNIDIASDDDNKAFVLLSHLLESKEQSSVHVVYSPKDKNNLTEKEIYNSYPEYDFGNKQSLTFNISYTNIKNRPYFSKVKISKFKIELISMGERTQ